jgi:hypothetical protein
MKRKFYSIYILLCNPLKLVAVVVLFLLASCVDHGYDLSKDIDLTFKLGGDSISGPVGSTDTVFLSKILKVDQSDMITTYQNKYYLVKNGNAENINVSVKKITSSPNVNTPFYTYTFLRTGDPTYKGSLSFPLNNVQLDQSMAMTLTGIPDEIKSLHALSLENAQATITVKINDASGTVNLTHLSNMVVTFPDFIVSSDLTDHKLVLNGDIPGGVVTKTINVQGIDLGKETAIVDHGLNFTGGAVYLNGGFTVNSSNNVSSMPNDVSFSFSMNFSAMTVSAATGEFDPNINVTVDPVKLNNLPDWLQDESVKLDIYNPEIKLDVVNPINIPVIVKNASITGSGTVSIPQLYIDAAKHSVNYITRQKAMDFDPSPINADIYHTTQMSNLNDVIATIPKQISITMPSVKADQSVEHSIELGKTYTLDMHYQVLIPFTFGGALNIAYNDTIDDLHKNLKDYYASEVVVTGVVCSDIPLDLTLSVTPIDSQGNDLSQYLTINVTKDIAAGGGSTTSVVSTPISVAITEKQSGIIKEKLNAFILKVGAASSSATAGKSLSSDQFLIVKNIHAKIVGGVTVDLNDN